jgi:hypothetical protein
VLLLIIFSARQVCCDTIGFSEPPLLKQEHYEFAVTTNYDSLQVKQISPDKAREEQLFSDKDLHYKKEAAKQVNWFAKFLDWLFERFFGETNPESRVTFYKTLQWIIVLAGVGVVIWLLMRSEFVKVLRGKPKVTVFNFADINEDIKGIDFNARIASAIQENNLRLAVRWYYLKQLNSLNSKGLIHWQTYKTNIDYFKELRSQSHKNGFRNISSIYDYVWYGQYELSPTNFTQVEIEFKEFEALVNNVQR